MSDKRAVAQAMAHVRKAISEARTNDAVAALADVVEEILYALAAEPELRIDYLKLHPRAAAPRET